MVGQRCNHNYILHGYIAIVTAHVAMVIYLSYLPPLPRDCILHEFQQCPRAPGKNIEFVCLLCLLVFTVIIVVVYAVYKRRHYYCCCL